MAEIDRDIGELKARMTAMERDTAEMKADMRDKLTTIEHDLREVRDVVVRAGGSWKAMVALASAAIVLGGLIMQAVTWIWNR